MGSEEPDFDDDQELRRPRWLLVTVVVVAAAMLVGILVPVLAMAFEL